MAPARPPTAEVPIGQPSVELISQAYEAFPHGVCIFDAEGRFLLVNRRFRDVLELPPEVGALCAMITVMAGRGDFGPGDVSAMVGRRLAALLSGGDFTISHQTASGRYVECQHTVVAGGEHVLVSLDITDHKLYEQALAAVAGAANRRADDTLEALVNALARVLGIDTVMVGQLTPGARGGEQRVTVLAANRSGHVAPGSTYRLRGSPCEQVVERQLCLLEDGVAERYPEDPMLSELGVVGYIGAPLKDSDGETLGLLAALSRSTIERPELARSVFEIFVERTASELERRENLRKLEYSEARLRDAIEATADGMVLYDADDRLVLWNEAYEQVYPSARHRLQVGKPFSTFLREVMAEGVVASAVDDPDGWLRDRLAQHHEACGEHERVIRGRTFTLRERRTSDGGIVAAWSDITERVKAEELLRHSQKMEAVGQLTGGIAHDFNNLLAIVMGNLQLLERKTEKSDGLQAYVEHALRAVERGSELTARLLAFSKRQPLQPELLDPADAIGEIHSLLRRTLPENIDITIRAVSGLTVNLDRRQLENAIINLAVNSRDAMTAGGELSITVSEASIGPGRNDVEGPISPGRYVAMRIADTGCGIERADLPRVFEPFFSTKGLGHGTGLGMSMIYGFVKQSGGYITVESSRGSGTTVVIYVPRASGRADEPRAGASPPHDRVLMGRGETVLLVEDDAAVRATTQRLLESLGYRAVLAVDAEAALSLIENGRKFDVLLADVVLPGEMSGPDLARYLGCRRPGVPVVFCSGYAEAEIFERHRLGETATILWKPFGRSELADALGAKLRRAVSGVVQRVG